MRINSIYRSVIGQSIYNRYNSSHNPNVGLHPRASQLQMDITQDRPVSQRWIQYTTGQSVYNEIHIQYRAGQSITLCRVTYQGWPASCRWIHTRLASQSKMDTIHNQPVSLQ